MDQFKDHYAWALYGCIYRHGWGTQEGCWASVVTMSKETGINHHKIRTTLKELQNAGFITAVQRPGRTTVYHPQWTPEAQLKTPVAGATQLPQPLPDLEGVPTPLIPDIAGAPLQFSEEVPLQAIEDEQEPINKNPLTRTPLIHPPNPPRGGSGLTAADRGEVIEMVAVQEIEQSEQPEQPCAMVPVTVQLAQATGSAYTNRAAAASRLMAVWNEHRPRGWNALRSMNTKRWELAMAFAQDLGGFDALLEALPIALHNAGRDRFWCAPGHDWNSFMGYGKNSNKGHFWRFLEQDIPRMATTNPDGSLTLAALTQQLKSVPRWF
jgi:hypothetical protein